MNIIAVIPAYNEEKTVGDVLSVLQQTSLIDRIIVVSDGSTDNTVEVAGKYDVDVVDLKENRGKGGGLAGRIGEHPGEGRLVAGCGFNWSHDEARGKPGFTGAAGPGGHDHRDLRKRPQGHGFCTKDGTEIIRTESDQVFPHRPDIRSGRDPLWRGSGPQSLHGFSTNPGGEGFASRYVPRDEGRKAGYVQGHGCQDEDVLGNFQIADQCRLVKNKIRRKVRWLSSWLI